jgi:hypothetical protein
MSKQRNQNKHSQLKRKNKKRREEKKIAEKKEIQQTTKTKIGNITSNMLKSDTRNIKQNTID